MENVTIRLTIGNFSVEITGPPEYAEKKLEELVGRYLTTAKPAPISEVRQSSALVAASGKQMAPGEFLKKVPTTSQPDRAAALAYFLENARSMKSFTTTELNEIAREAKTPFGNVSDVVYRLVSRGLMMSAGDKEGQRAYALTASGEEYVESILEAK
jgi:predicted transcriptional regulator